VKILRESHEDEYLLSFWTRESRPGKNGEFPPPQERLMRILGKFPYKFPCEGKKELSWQVAEISTLSELGQLWRNRDEWLKKWGIEEWSHWLKDLAGFVQKGKFFEKPKNRSGKCSRQLRQVEGSKYAQGCARRP
jgi:hypothetical protein